MFMTNIGGVQRPKRALAAILESHLETTSLIPTSYAKNMPTSMAFTSASSGPKGW